MTDDELTKICQIHILSKYSQNWDMIYLPPNVLLLQPHHIDILLSSGFYSDRISLFRRIANLTSEQIDKGLADACRDVRIEAYNHKLCTDVQKVKYHLMWGDDGIVR